jgi:hypothetical protein
LSKEDAPKCIDGGCTDEYYDSTLYLPPTELDISNITPFSNAPELYPVFQHGTNTGNYSG